MQAEGLNLIGPKLKELRIFKNLTLEEVGKHVGKSKQMISYYESSKNLPPLEVLVSLAELYGVTLDELRRYNYREIEKFKNDIAYAHEEQNKWAITDQLRKSSPLRSVLYLRKLPNKDADLYIPYYDVEITAGKIELYFDDVDEDPEGYVYAPQYKGCIMCNVKGDSMYDRIFPGARLYVAHLPNKKYIDFGQIYLVVLDGYRLLKYIHKHPEDDTKVILSSHNKHYGDWDVEKADILNLFIVKGYENQSAI